MQYNFSAFDIVTKAEAAKAEPVLPFPGRNVGKLLDRMAAGSIEWILTKNGSGFFVPCGEFLMLFSKRCGKSVKVRGGEDGESRRHTFWR
jgi:hypothetical protein